MSEGGRWPPWVGCKPCFDFNWKTCVASLCAIHFFSLCTCDFLRPDLRSGFQFWGDFQSLCRRVLWSFAAAELLRFRCHSYWLGSSACVFWSARRLSSSFCSGVFCHQGLLDSWLCLNLRALQRCCSWRFFSAEFFSLPSASLFAPRGTAQHWLVTFSSCSRTPVFLVCGTDAFSLDSFLCACLGLVQLPFLISSWISLSLSRSAPPGVLPLVLAPAVANLVYVLVLCFGVCHDLSSAAHICFSFKCWLWSSV
jgi:hypothetical protein